MLKEWVVTGKTSRAEGAESVEEGRKYIEHLLEVCGDIKEGK